MNLGEKIRRARLDASMTQAALAGDFITRNMLSQIENGTATPSVQTIQYISERLGIPVGYFMADKEGEGFYKRMKAIPEIRALLSKKDYEKCASKCLALSDFDDEINHILSLCYYNMGRECFDNGRIVKAHSMLEKMLAYSEKTVYTNPASNIPAVLMLMLIASIDPNLKSKYSGEESMKRIKGSPDSYIYYAALNDIYLGKTALLSLLPEAEIAKNAIYQKHMSAISEMDKKNYQRASEYLREIDLDGISPVLRYKILSDLEICSQNTSDFQNAYLCSSAKLELFRAMHD